MGHLPLVLSTIVPILFATRSQSTPLDVLLSSHPNPPASTWRTPRRTGVTSAGGGHFFLTIADRIDLVAGSTRDWKAVIAARRTEREHHLTAKVPDTIRDWTAARQQTMTEGHTDGDCVLSGMPISAGTVTGPARLIRSAADWSKVRPGEILVVSVIDPGLAPSSVSQEV